MTEFSGELSMREIEGGSRGGRGHGSQVVVVEVEEEVGEEKTNIDLCFS